MSGVETLTSCRPEKQLWATRTDRSKSVAPSWAQAQIASFITLRIGKDLGEGEVRQAAEDRVHGKLGSVRGRRRQPDEF
jgi:hypothetical protein